MTDADATADPAVAVLSDTHATTGTALAGRARDAVERADLVVHAGDFTTAAVLDAFYGVADRLAAVHGNADDDAVADRLPGVRTASVGGVRIAVVHRSRGGATGLAMLGRERDADLVVSGHTHRSRVVADGRPTLLNPGSHATPRGGRPTHAELRLADAGLAGTIRTRDGEVVETFDVPAGDERDERDGSDGGKRPR